MRRFWIVAFLALFPVLAAPPASAGKLDSVTQTVKSLVAKKAGAGSGGHAQGAADLIKGKSGGLGSKAGGLLGNDKLNIFKKKKG